MAVKGYSTSHQATELEPHHQMQFSVIPRTFIEWSVTQFLISLFNGISTFVGYFNAKAILLEEL